MKKTFLVAIMILLSLSQAQANKRAPFLIMDMIPHLTMDIKNNWDNKELGLDEKQKVKLLEIRKSTISNVKSVKMKLAPLEKEVSSKIIAGAKPEELKNLVNQISQYKAEATMTHLNCVYKTQQVLSKKQLKTLKML
jgi:hypothetical protein